MSIKPCLKPRARELSKPVQSCQDGKGLQCGLTYSPTAVGPQVTPFPPLGLSMIGLENTAQRSRAEVMDSRLKSKPRLFLWLGRELGKVTFPL